MATERNMKTGLVYFIQSGDCVKIGFCERDPIRRLEKLQVGNPVKLKLLALVEGSRIDEGSWHMRFDKLRVRGEWFRMNRTLRSAIKPHEVDHNEVSRCRPEKKIYGVLTHKLYAALDEMAAADAAACEERRASHNPMESTLGLSNNFVPSRNAA